MEEPNQRPGYAAHQNKLALLEAALFTTEEPLSLRDVARKVMIIERQARELIEELKRRYENEESGIMLTDIGGYKLVVKPQYISLVSRLTTHSEMSRGLLRVLSLIAFHEPVMQSDIVKSVGNRAYEYIKVLHERGLVRSEKKSRTRILMTTKQFEEYFGVDKEQLKKMIAMEKQAGVGNEEKRDDSAGNQAGSG